MTTQRLKVLAPVDYLILGLVARLQPCTSYDLKREVQQTVSHFWTFSHTALYQAPTDLVTAGLLTVTQEAEGRRRRLYRLTASGKDTLEAWLTDTATSAQPIELRDLALLKLFLLGSHTQPQLPHAIAIAQIDYHATRLGEFEESLEKYLTGSTYPTRIAALRFGCKWEQLAVEFWTELAAEQAAAAASNGHPLPQQAHTEPAQSIP